METKLNDKLFQQLMTKPKISWLTFMIFVLIITGFITSTTLAINHYLSIPMAITLNTLASYIAYSVLHEAAHGLVSTKKIINNWIGRVSLSMLSISPFFGTYRFLHMTHHRFTNDPEKDPDYFCGTGPTWSLPIRWMIMDAAYITIYFKAGFYSTRPKAEKIEFWLAVTFGITVLIVITTMGLLIPFLLLYFIPSRIALFLLVITFDYLPHYPHNIKSEDNEYQATNNRIGLEWLLTPLLLGQNYHLVHHLYPNTPFYRYKKIWLAKKKFHESHNPAIVKFYQLMPVKTKQLNAKD